MSYKKIAFLVLGAALLGGVVTDATARTGGDKARHEVSHKARSVMLFGVKLKGAQRDTLSAAVLKAGGEPKKGLPSWLGWVKKLDRSDSDSIVDTYAADRLITGAQHLQIFYAKDSKRFEHAQYDFPLAPEANPAERVTQLVSMLSQKYGQPAMLRQEGGEAEMPQWRFPDGMTISIESGGGEKQKNILLVYRDEGLQAEKKQQQVNSY